jgi:uncharacterized membrane protein HdeD (DUF308 family)
MKGVLGATLLAFFCMLIVCIVSVLMHPERYDHPGRPLLLLLGLLGSIVGLVLSTRFLGD